MPEELTRWLYDPAVGRLVSALFGVILVLGLRGVIQRRFVGQVADIDSRYRARKAIGVISWVMMVMILFAVFSDQLGSFTVAFGVAGAGIAFALQEIIASVAGWISITFGRAYRVGDRIKLGETMGDVIDIGVLRTTLMECGAWIDGDNYNGRIVTVANSFLFKGPLVNYSGHFPFLWDEIAVPIRHGSNIPAVQHILEHRASELLGDYTKGARRQWSDMVARYRIEDAQVDPMVTMRADANWMTFTLRYVVDFRSRRGTKDQLWRAILADLQQQPDAELACSTLELSVGPSTHPLPVSMGQA